MELTVVQSARRIDPTSRLDEKCDLLIADGNVARVGQPGDADAWDLDHAEVIAAPAGAELIVCPGLVDLHTHLYGAAGIADIDSIGVNAAVPVVADAGGAGASTIDDFVSHRLPNTQTRVRTFLSIEAGGIVEPDPGHNTNKRPTQMRTASMDDFLAALHRHETRVVGLKVWATSTAGISWVDHAASLSEFTNLPMLVHIGDLKPSPTTPSITGDVLDRLQGGDIVTHCFTPLPGSLVQPSGEILNEVVVAVDRGVLFDAAPGAVNFSFDRARMALDAGWLPNTISTDLHRWCHRAPLHSLPQVMSWFLALGVELADVIERASVRPAAALGETIGRPVVGEPATLSFLWRREGAAIFSDGSGGSVKGSEWLEPAGCMIDGTWFQATSDVDEARVLSDAEEGAERSVDFLRELEVELTRMSKTSRRWRGEELHAAVHRIRSTHELELMPALDALFAELAPVDPLVAAGWSLEQLGPTETLRRLSAGRPGRDLAHH